MKDFANILLKSELATLWYHPGVPYVLIAYAAASKTWKFLHATSEEKLPVDCLVYLALRNAMPGAEALRQQQSDDVPPYIIDKGMPVQARSSQEEAPDENLSPSLSLSAQGPTEVVSEEQRDRPTVRSSTEAEAPYRRREDSMSTDSSSLTHGQSDEVQTNNSNDFIPFEQKYSITYHHLTRSTFMSRSVVDTSRTRFFLAFPQAASSEEESLRQYLGSKTMPSLIFTNDEYGWDTFKEFTGSRGDKQGVIIIS